jgi:hypothetical protein
MNNKISCNTTAELYNKLIQPNVSINDVYNIVLHRIDIMNNIIDYLTLFDENSDNLLFKRGIYIYGDNGIGKTSLILNLLKTKKYDIIQFNSSDIRTKQNLSCITNNQMGSKNITNMFYKEKKIIIVMDEIDSMNTGDKGGLSNLIQIIRPKKSKKQKTEPNTQNPIICISNQSTDKKNNELCSSCKSFELTSPSFDDIKLLIEILLYKKYNINCDDYTVSLIAKCSNKNLHSLNNIIEIYYCTFNEIMEDGDVSMHNKKHKINDMFNKYINVIYNSSTVYNTKEITKKMLNCEIKFESYSKILNETDKTTVGLLYHENIIDVIYKNNNCYSLYLSLLDNFCFADYIDRIIFQRQIWQLNELSSIIKIYNNNNFLFNEPNQNYSVLKNTRFTKILTKYSTEYNNYIFISEMSQKLNIDINDLFTFFIIFKCFILNAINNDHELQESNDNIIKHIPIQTIKSFEKIINLKILTQIDINRLYRYIENVYNL